MLKYLIANYNKIRWQIASNAKAGMEFHVVNLLKDELILLGKYGFDYIYRSARMTNSLIRQLYENLPEKTPEKTGELETVLSHKSRVARDVALQTLVVCSANKHYGKLPADPIYMAALQKIICVSSSMRDDVHDIWIVPNFLVNQLGSTAEDIFKMIDDDSWMCEFAKTQQPSYDKKTGRVINPSNYANGSVMLSSFYEREIKRLNPKAFDTYVAGRSDVMKVQADDMHVGMMLRRNDIEGVLKKFGEGERYERNVLKILGKLGIIGREAPVIVNQIVWTGDEGKREEVDLGLREYCEPLTDLGQAGHDDMVRTEEDLEERTGNIFTLLMLPHYPDISKESMRRFMLENPKVPSEVFTPLIERIYGGLRTLRELDFAYADGKRAARRLIKTVRNDMQKFEEKFHVDLDWGWFERYKELEAKDS